MLLCKHTTAQIHHPLKKLINRSEVEAAHLSKKPLNLAQLKQTTSYLNHLPYNNLVKKEVIPSTASTETSKHDIKKAFTENPEKFILPFDNFIAFLDNTFGNKNPYQEALRFRNDIKSLLQILYETYPHLQERSLRNRFTRISKCIKEKLKSEEIETSSIASLPPTDINDDKSYSDTSQIPLSSNLPANVQLNPMELR
ncbi:hypothetical protein HHI36_001099 [Cryptolaemus montrouzieri]|uniref:Uncharacterized protein n=1 Tax=Cryptolaemus montrouzieri TaxID=559131 RepID=A0ABD2P701_9CUCU